MQVKNLWAISIALVSINLACASDFSLVDMANQNRAREAAAAQRVEQQGADQRADEWQEYELKVPKTQADYDYERRKKRDENVRRAIEDAEETLRNSDADRVARKKRFDQAQCRTWLAAIDNVSVGSKAVETVMGPMGYPGSISKYRTRLGEVEDWKYQNSACYISISVSDYRVIDVYTAKD